ncbi:MAG TPA: carboxypeptidase regulatory-like domain-containing protein [Candidatus Acidoferrum sp.]|nr:carboxypeptidase regulatory-like domain-containing protein [Candidatus Acidoferrum sp.]
MKLFERNTGSFVCWFTSVVALALLFAPLTMGQSTGGRIRGTVTDQTGGAVAAVKVQLVNESTHATREVQSNENGEFIFIEVPVGTYEITASQTGFKKYVRKGIPLNLNEVLTVDIPLQLGGGSETVEVTGAPPIIDTTSTQLGAVVNERSSTQLPLNQRDVFQLLQLQPGVQSQIGNNLFYGSDKPGVVTVNGGRGRSNNYSVNGGDSNDLFANLPAVQPSPDSIEEFRVISNSFDAEYGRNSGAVVNVVTKSGTNDLHGSAYEFFRNDVLNAHGFTFQPTPKPPFKQNQFGGTLGGPIKKDKTFIFGSYEGRRIVRGIVSQSVPVPTGDDYAGTFTGAPTDAVVFPGMLNDSLVANILQNRCGSASPGGSKLTAGGQAALDAAAGGTPQLWDSIFPSTTGPGGAPVAAIPTQCFDPVAVNLAKQFLVGSGGTNSETQDVVKSRDRGDQFQIRFDHILNKDHKLSVYYYYDNDNTLDPFAIFQLAGGSLGNFGGRIITHAQQLNASHTWTIGNSSVNEFRFTYFREAQPQFYTPLHTNAVVDSCGNDPAASPFCFTGKSDTSLIADDGTALGQTPNCPGFGCGIHPGLGSKFEGVPFVTFNGTQGLFGNNFEGQLPQTGNTFQFNDNFSKIIGNHSFKFGGDIRYQKFDQKLFFNVNGEYIFGPGGNNDTGATDLYANYLLGLPVSYSQGSANTELVRSTSVYLFAQDSWKIRPNVTLNYGLRWEMNTPLTDVGKKVQRFNPGQNSTIYPCQLSSTSNLFGTGNDCDNQGVTPTGLVFPGDKGVPNGLIGTYYKAFAPRLGLNWSPAWKDNALAKLTGGPNKTTISMGWGLFYNPIEQLVLEQFSAEPPFGISNGVFDPLFSTPFVAQDGSTKPNVSDKFLNPPRNQPVDWSLYRPIVLFGQFPTKLRTQYSAQYNLTIKRELPGNMLFQIGYVGSQGHRLLAIHDQNAAAAQPCLDLQAISDYYTDPAHFDQNLANSYACGPFFEDSSFNLPANTVPNGFTLHLPYGSVSSVGPGNPAITLVGLRPFASPNCQPTTGIGCPTDGNEIFSSIFSEDTVAHSNYNSLQSLFEKRFSHGLQFQASYTYSKSLDNASSFEEILNPLNFNSTYGPSLFDSRHRFVFNYVWELPIPKKEGFAGKALNGWEVSGIYTYQSGFPILINNCDDQELQGSTLGFECPGKPDLLGKIKTHDPRIDGNVFTDLSLFTDSATGVIGNSPRTLCCNPPISNWDIGVFKTTPVSEKVKLEFRTEIFNIFNHSQFYGVDGGTSNTTFGQPQKVRDPRLVQFALKLVF